MANTHQVFMQKKLILNKINRKKKSCFKNLVKFPVKTADPKYTKKILKKNFYTDDVTGAIVSCFFDRNSQSTKSGSTPGSI